MYLVYSHVQKYDWFLLGAVFCLITLGAITLFSLSGISAFPFFERQLYWIAIGVAAMVAVSFFVFRFCGFIVGGVAFRRISSPGSGIMVSRWGLIVSTRRACQNSTFDTACQIFFQATC